MPSQDPVHSLFVQERKFSDKAAVSAYYAEKAKAAEEAKAAAAEKARLEREANPTTEDLLKEIRDLLKKEN